MDKNLNNIPCGYLVLNDEGVLLEVNDKVCGMVQCLREEIMDSHIETILTPGAKVFYQSYLFPMLKMEGKVNEVYLTLQTKDGKGVPVLINAERSSENGAHISRCIIVQMSRRSAYEDRILLDKKEAKKTSEEKERLLSMLSHELRSPLNVILGMVELLSDQLNGDGHGDEYKYLGLIKNAGKDLARLANDILNFAKLESGYFEVNREVILLEEVLMNSFMAVIHDAESKGIKMARSEKTTLNVLADEDRLKQVMMNLLTNAVKYTESGGKIVLSTKKEGQFVQIEVKDTGVGIPADKIDQIFQPFIRIGNNDSGPKEGGFGLGLPITKKLVHLMGGSMSVSSKPGEGSVFSVQIPLADY